MDTAITIHIEGCYDICLTLSPKYKTAKIIAHIEDLDSLTITSEGRAGHDVTIEAEENYETPTINSLILKGENIRYHRSDDCYIPHLYFVCNNIKLD